MGRPRFFRTFASAVLLLFALSCTTTDVVSGGGGSVPVPEQFLWEDAGGADYCFVSGGGVRYHAVRIDLSRGGIEILAYPVSAGGSEGLRSREFARMTGASVAMNTAPFSKERTILGAHIVGGNVVSRPIARYSALVFDREGDGGFSARVVESQGDGSLDGAEFAFGGFFTVLKGGEVREFPRDIRDARSAAGVSADGRTLYLLAVEKGWLSRGLSFPECAEVLRSMGAEDALEFDGGSSTSFLVEGRGVRLEESFRDNVSYMGFSFH